MIVLNIAVVMIVCVSSSAATRHVPSDYPTIQSAINDCVNGDTVIVAAGTYNERIDYSGKNIVVTSEHPDDPATVATTIIDAGGTGSVVTFTNGETQDALLTGFTITGGYGTDPFDEGGFYGGGILCAESSPTITKNVIVNNRGPASAEPEVISYGGGIGCFASNAVITNNIIKDNAAFTGAGIMVLGGNARVANNVIYGNSAVFGGGAYAHGGLLSNNTIVANDVSLLSDILPIDDRLGGNVYATSDRDTGEFETLVVNNIICSAASGAGIYSDSLGDDAIAFNDVWGNLPGNYIRYDPMTLATVRDGPADRTGKYGNISEDPLFAHSEAGDYHLLPDSPCISAGDPTFIAASGQTDIDGEDRVYAVRVDIGADEFVGPVRLVAHAGADQYMDRRQQVTLDGSGSFFRDPCGVNAYAWTQVGGPTVELSDANAAQPMFMAELVGDCRFELVISDGAGVSEPDEVLITVVNQRPIADAGDDQTFQVVVGEVLLDGSGSYDPVDDALTYRWTQVAGPAVELSDPNTAETSFNPVETGVYVFSLVVSDDLADSEADTVGIVVGNNAPVARAGSSRYAATDPVVLDGMGSYDPDGYGVLSYQWTHVSGPIVSIADADTATPTVGGFVQTSSIQKCEFKLMVSDGEMNSQPDKVEVIIVPSFGNITLVLENPPFDPNKPTFIFFSGGNGGSRLGVGRPWTDRANIISFSTKHNGTNLPQHGDAIIVYLSSVAPDYRQRIQTSGFSKGGKLPIGVGAHLNTTYADSRYNVNHATLLDAPGPTILDIPEFLNSSVGGEQSWLDNYRAGPFSAYPGREPDGALTVYFPLGDHGTPPTWYLTTLGPEYDNWIGDFYNNGITAGAYYSVAGPGKNLELAPHSESLRYYFEWEWPLISPAPLKFYNESLYPGRLPELPTLVGPADGDTVDANGVVLSCQVCQNVVGYQLLTGPNPYDLKYIISDTPSPPENIITAFPHETIYWTIKVRDQYGSTIFLDPRRLDVSDPVSQSVENVTKGRRYFLIQEAIDEAADGDEIVVSANRFDYVEDICFNGRSVTLRSSSSGGEAAVIMGTGTGPVVTFSGGEDANCVLMSGFTITGGNSGIYGTNNATPVIDKCIITGNIGAGIELYSGGNPTLTNCTIIANGGSGIEMRPHKAGRFVYYNSPKMSNCVIAANNGHGLLRGIPTVTNCTIAGNLMSGIKDSMVTVTNSIVYFNGNGSDQIVNTTGMVTYSNVQGSFEGTGNIDADPLFADSANGDYHLKSQAGKWDPISQSWVMDSVTSPCIDVGDPTSSFDLEPEPDGGRINMGAYGGTIEASKSP
jgi:parallel beta-helix repeat protein